MTVPLFLVAGLGNPGSRYERTRHNVGFRAIDTLAARHGVSLDRERLRGLFASVHMAGNRVLLVKPQTYMNRSGECLRAFVDYYRVPLDNILLIHDDLDLHLGRIRVRARGGAGGHNGIRSVISHLGSSEFARVRIGIGRPPKDGEAAAVPVEQYVLSPFSAREEEVIRDRLELAGEAVELFITRGVDYCMNRINGSR